MGVSAEWITEPGSRSPGPDRQWSGEAVFALLADAVTWHCFATMGVEVLTEFTASPPEWIPDPHPSWLSAVTMTLTWAGGQTRSELLWPVSRTLADASPCLLDPERPIVAGRHDGYYLGRPLAVGQGVRLRPGLHLISRATTAGAFLVEPVIAPDLGRNLRVRPATGDGDRASPDSRWEKAAALVLGQGSGRFVSARTRDCVLRGMGFTDANPDGPTLAEAMRSAWNDACRDPQVTVRRTAAAINRLFGGDEVMAELVFTRASQIGVRTERVDADAAMSAFADKFVRAADSARQAIASGRAGTASVISPLEATTTLAGIEQAARTSFMGFRGLGRIRGRPDLRVLDQEWRGTLCPVQTTESADIGLVRFATVGARHDCPDTLAAWGDLSASAALIPFINHDEPARASIGSKNLKQAVPVIGCEPPRVTTGWEAVFGSVDGVVRAPVRGRVVEVGDGTIRIESATGSHVVPFGRPQLQRSGPETCWMPVVNSGDVVNRGEVLAHAPDVRVSIDENGEQVAQLCLGVNALVALTPWYGLNYEDAIVVSRPFADRLTSIHTVQITQAFVPGDVIAPVDPGTEVNEGDSLATLGKRDGSSMLIASPVAGEVVRTDLDRFRGELSVTVRVVRQLQVGDKLSNRHQGKGVVSKILAEDEMPRLPDGTPVEVILNPLGVLRRLNLGQLWEMHTSLDAGLGAEGGLVEGFPVQVGRQVDDPDALAQRLHRKGAPGGRLQLHLRDGTPLGTEPVVVGWQYLLKLDHLAAAKLSRRGAEPATAVISGQPSAAARWEGGRRVGGAQRLGEMEVWALEAAGAGAVLKDALQTRSGEASGRRRASLRSVEAHLAVAGIRLVANGGDQSLAECAAASITTLTPAWRVDPLPELPNWRDLARRVQDARGFWLGTPARRPERYGQLLDWHRAGWSQESICHTIGISRPELLRWRTEDPEFDAVLSESVEPCDWLASGPQLGQLPEFTAASRNLIPLHDARVLGGIRTAQRERTCFAIPLPVALPHPWQRQGSLTLPLITQVPVLAPAFRILNPTGAIGLDYLYVRLVEEVLEYTRLVELERDGSGQGRARPVDALVAKAEARLREVVLAILGSGDEPEPESIAGRLSGKQGLLRRFLLGQAVLYSGRGVIVPDWNQDPDEVALPHSLAVSLEVTALEEKGEVVLLNRQPTLHPYSIVALRARVLDGDEGDAVRVHPLTLKGLAGDFDGDTAAVHRPHEAAAREQAWQLLSPAARLRSSADGSLLAKVDLDVALGLLLAGRTPSGRQRLGELLPSLPADMDAAAQGTVLASLADDLEATEALRRLHEIEKLGCELATGWSIGALELLDDSPSPRLEEALAAGVAGGDPSVRQLKDTYLRGVEDDAYFQIAPAALSRLADKKLTSPFAGALTKTLVEIADHVTIAGDSCGQPADRSGVRSPLSCRETDGVCRACYGPAPDTGVPPTAGSRIGVLAAMLIGERSVQASMKTFHGGGTGDDLASDLRDLRAVFGLGTSVTAFGADKTLAKFLARRKATYGWELAAELRPVVERARTLMAGKVAAVHIEVILRQLVETHLQLAALQAASPPGSRGLVACAQRRGRTRFEMATTRGHLQWLLIDIPDEQHGGFRTRLATGDVS